LGASLATALLSVTIGAWAAGTWWIGGIVGLTAGAAPPTYLRARCRRRRDKLCQQLPEAFDLMSRAIRAGQTVAGAFQIVGRDLEPPISVEFSHCYEQQNLGRSPDLALRDLARRTGVMELQMFVVALLVQRQSGGNMAELLNNLSGVVRKRIRLKGRVKALTGEGRMQAVVLTILPLAVFAAMLSLNRPYTQTLLDRPQVLGGIVICQVVGALWIRHIVNVDY
jgi:tight adherence protein B